MSSDSLYQKNNSNRLYKTGKRRGVDGCQTKSCFEFGANLTNILEDSENASIASFPAYRRYNKLNLKRKSPGSISKQKSLIEFSNCVASPTKQLSQQLASTYIAGAHSPVLVPPLEPIIVSKSQCKAFVLQPSKLDHLTPDKTAAETNCFSNFHLSKDTDESKLSQVVPDVHIIDSNKTSKFKRPAYLRWLIIFLTLTMIVAAIYIAHEPLKDVPCFNDLILFQPAVLEEKVKNHVFGQHVAVNVTLSLVNQFIAKKLQIVKELQEPNYVPSEIFQKALVLSFHGWSGVGKNFLSNMLAQAMPSANIQRFIVTLHFPHQEHGAEYARLVHSWVMGNLTRCNLNLIIIDEVDKSSAFLLEGFESLLAELHQQTLEYSIFVILLSNTAGSLINKHVMLQSKEDRERVTVDELNKAMMSKDDWHTRLFNRGLITSLVPFMPLTREHVKMCIKFQLLVMEIVPEPLLVDEIADDIHYFPREIMYSQSGCKQVTAKTYLHITNF